MGYLRAQVLGHILFNIYIRSLGRVIRNANVEVFGFADDHQLIKSFLPIFQINALSSELNECFKLISEWMNTFFLKLNPSKTKILLIIPPSLRRTVLIHGTYINGKCIRFVNSAKNLGITLDDELSFDDQVNKVVKSSFLTIRNLSKLKTILTSEQMKIAICTLVFGKLDYCNSLYYGINSTLLSKLQSVQNAAARLTVRGNNYRKSMEETIRKNHWLKVKERIIFKLCLITHKCLNDRAPESLSSLLIPSSSVRSNKLQQQSHNSNFGDRCYSRTAPKLWNLLPEGLRLDNNTEKFKKGLKRTVCVSECVYVCM